MLGGVLADINPPLDLSSQMRLILMLFRHIHFLKKYHRATGAPLIARENEFFEYFHVFCCPHTSIFWNVTKSLIFRKFYNNLELLENLMSREIANSRPQHSSWIFTVKIRAKTHLQKWKNWQTLCMLIPQAIALSRIITPYILPCRREVKCNEALEAASSHIPLDS